MWQLKHLINGNLLLPVFSVCEKNHFKEEMI